MNFFLIILLFQSVLILSKIEIFLILNILKLVSVKIY
ncbi:hypothetical protein J2780_002542 [Chryseobacterium camelliae]|nr:hypothetical protein [Chryseobacterium camelliae]